MDQRTDLRSQHTSFAKPTFLLAVLIFEVGSLICAVSQDSKTLIIGRAIAGLGAGGVSGGVHLIVGLSCRPSRAPLLLGIVGASFAMARVVGPLLGGVFTEHLSWRWCFYINLPIGGVAAAVIFFYYTTPPHAKSAEASLGEKILQMDLGGAALIPGAVTCFLLGLQWGGITKSWQDSTVIGTLTGSGLLLVAFTALEIYLGERAALIPRIVRQKTVALAMVYQTDLTGCFFSFLYYLPIYFQSVSGMNAADSGVRTIPLVAGAGVFSIVVGMVITLTRDYQLLVLIGCTMVTIGAGLMYTLDQNSTSAQWIGYQVLEGIGLGCTMQVRSPRHGPSQFLAGC
ncbi:MFS gliotoxin efflux transporter gliA [Fulvia fulva]|nr:MFS gliotoxin efflux transporter gliA [Fulvia fulva]WPV13607.1 MFS gliotoxin efflux transporter gliA [Fulvia fulva]